MRDKMNGLLLIYIGLLVGFLYYLFKVKIEEWFDE